jgi:hypothetical protein
MEIEIDFSKLSNKRLYYGFLAGIAAVLLLVSLAFLGKPLSPLAVGGDTRLLTWQDWQTAKIERQYRQEIGLLRSDADALATLLNQSPNAVAAQVAGSRITRHAADGLAALASARLTLAQAAQDTLAWSSGTLDRDTALGSLQNAVDLLK